MSVFRKGKLIPLFLLVSPFATLAGEVGTGGDSAGPAPVLPSDPISDSNSLGESFGNIWNQIEQWFDLD